MLVIVLDQCLFDLFIKFRHVHDISITSAFTHMCLSSHNKSILLFLNTPNDSKSNTSQGSGGFPEGNKIQSTTLQPAHIIHYVVWSATCIIHFSTMSSARMDDPQGSAQKKHCMQNNDIITLALYYSSVQKLHVTNHLYSHYSSMSPTQPSGDLVFQELRASTDTSYSF